MNTPNIRLTILEYTPAFSFRYACLSGIVSIAVFLMYWFFVGTKEAEGFSFVSLILLIIVLFIHFVLRLLEYRRRKPNCVLDHIVIQEGLVIAREIVAYKDLDCAPARIMRRDRKGKLNCETGLFLMIPDCRAIFQVSGDNDHVNELKKILENRGVQIFPQEQTAVWDSAYILFSFLLSLAVYFYLGSFVFPIRGFPALQIGIFLSVLGMLLARIELSVCPFYRKYRQRVLFDTLISSIWIPMGLLFDF